MIETAKREIKLVPFLGRGSMGATSHMPRQEYVAGFLFSEDRRSVVLIRKEKPDWQRGLLNGVGGKIEPGETATLAMFREFFEETGAVVANWNKYTTLVGSWGVVHVFRSFNDSAFNDARTCTDEQIGHYYLENLHRGPLKTIPNLAWLIPMALSMDSERADSFTVMER